MDEKVHLSDPQGRLRIEYSPAAMEHIRKQARDALMSVPRIGMGVGGLLIGVREGGLTQLLDSIEIPCSHSSGPSFNLTAAEKELAGEMIAAAGLPDASGNVSVIGWYFSKTRGDAVPNESDRKLFDELCPGPGQVALVLRPNAVEPMRAAFFFRNENGELIKGVECNVEEWRPAANLELEASPEDIPEDIKAEASGTHEIPIAPPIAGTLSESVELPEPVEVGAPGHAETRLSDLIDLTSSDVGSHAGETAVKAGVRPQSAPVPGLTAPQLGRRGKLRLILPLGATLLAAGAAAFLTRDYWMPKPPLTLTTTELNGNLEIRWNPDALRGIDHASMFLNDGGQPIPSLIPLDRVRLSSGLLSYTPKSQRVTAKLDAGEITAITAWFAQERPAQATPAQATPAPRNQPPFEAVPANDAPGESPPPKPKPLPK